MKCFLFAFLPFVFSQLAFSAITFNLTEESGGVQITVSGAVDVTGLTFNGFSNIDVGNALNSFESQTVANGQDGGVVSPPTYTGATVDLQVFLTNQLFGPEFATLPNISLTDGFLPGQTLLFIPVEYSNISSPPAPINILLNGETFATLGIIDGVTSSASWDTGTSTESISFRTGSAVPEPTSSLFLVLGLISGLIRRSR